MGVAKQLEYYTYGNFFSETYRFENVTCKAAIDFEQVFKRFRNK